MKERDLPVSRVSSVKVSIVEPDIVGILPDDLEVSVGTYANPYSSVYSTDPSTRSLAPSTRSCSHRVTLGGFTITRSDEDFSDSDLGSMESGENDNQVVMDALCGNALIDNKVAAIFTNKMGPRDSVERALSGLLEDAENDCRRRSLWVMSQRPSMADLNASPGNLSAGHGKRDSIRSNGSIQEKSIKSLFAQGSAKHMKPHHNSVNRVVKHIFGLEDLEFMKISTAQDWRVVKSHDYRFRRKLATLVASTPFVWFFMSLTVYVLFGPDLIKLYGSKSLDKAFLTLHTVVFFLFCSEFLLLGISTPGYLCGLGAPLDLVAIFSLLGDTWFLQDSTLEGSSIMQRSRLARLARVARVARITRLVPRIIAIFRNQRRVGWAKSFVVRRLRRIFLFLDMDRDGYISSFDVKVFYLSLLQDCSSMVYHTKSDVLTADAELLMALAPEGTQEAELDNTYSFQQFVRIFFSMMLGRDVLLYHLNDMQDQSGVWALTARLTDKSALKVCAGILTLVVFMKLLETEFQETSFQQGLFHTYLMVVTERQLGQHSNSTFVCTQIEDFVAEMKVLFLYVDGFIWKDHTGDASCSSPLSFDGDPFARMNDLMSKATLRTSEVVQACLPHYEDSGCRKGRKQFVVALADVEQEAKNDIFFSLLAAVVCMIIIMGFIIAFANGINSFARSTLQPLRALVDDMSAMSAVELVHIDAERMSESVGNFYETDVGSALDVKTKVEELVHLQKSFHSMKSVIRSWSKYVPPTVVQKLLNAGMEASVGVSKTCATVLFVDVDGFEDACSGMGPDEVNYLLATVFERIAYAISNNRGTLLEFIADEVLAVFNTPTPLRSHTHAAVITALEIHTLISTLPPLATPDGRTINIRCRCGVHTAQILAGNIGSQRRMKYGLLGDGVNLTARLKGLNSRYNTQTIASATCYADDLTSRRVIFRPLDLVAVKGKTEALMVYEVMGLSKGNEEAFLIHMAAQKHSEAFKLYHERRFAEAKVMFSEVASEYEAMEQRCRLSASTLDHPARLMRKRCIKYMKDPPGPDWDGVERLKAKTFEVVEEEEEDDDDPLDAAAWQGHVFSEGSNKYAEI